jgi:glycosyltransferase involved in cell wall biosynthesis
MDKIELPPYLREPKFWVSVLIPSYNTKPLYIKECLESIRQQKGHFGIELVWINDGSSSEYSAYLEEELKSKYNDLDIHFNRKDTINSELDIYVPSMKIAFELNGIFHYEPIYGDKKLNQIQNNDTRKFQACLEKGIEMCIIDVSSLSYFKPANAKKFLDIVCGLVDSKMAEVAGLEPASSNYALTD